MSPEMRFATKLRRDVVLAFVARDARLRNCSA